VVSAKQRVPATVLTGCLGAGKTTLLNRLLSENHGHRFAVIVNEFGSVGIDGDLIEGADEELLEMNNGCVCCTVRGDLIRTIRQLLAAENKLDGILIETTGLAMPAPVAQSFFVDAVIRSTVRLDSITTVVDALNIEQQLESRPEAAEQIAFADQLIISKTANISESRLSELKSLLSGRNATARIRLFEEIRERPLQILDCGGFDLDRVSDEINQIRREDAFHDHEIGTLTLESEHAMNADRVTSWLRQLVAERGAEILRAKGFINIAGESRPLVFQSVHMLLEGDYAERWPVGRKPLTRLVFIGRNLDQRELSLALDQCR
jgi:G3E family GTPase